LISKVPPHGLDSVRLSWEFRPIKNKSPNKTSLPQGLAPSGGLKEELRRASPKTSPIQDLGAADGWADVGTGDANSKTSGSGTTPAAAKKRTRPSGKGYRRNSMPSGKKVSDLSDAHREAYAANTRGVI
jgi:hypothetical protein